MSVSYNFAICKWRHSVTKHKIWFHFSCLMSILLGCKNSVKTHKFINLCDFTEFLSPVCMCIGCRWARHTPLLQKRWGKCQTTIGTFQPWGTSAACQIKRVEKTTWRWISTCTFTTSLASECTYNTSTTYHNVFILFWRVIFFNHFHEIFKNGLSVFIIIDKMGETHEVVIMREISPFVVFQLFQFENWVFQFPVLGLYYNFHSSTKNLLKCIFIIRYILLNKNYIIFFPDFHWILWWWSPRQYNCWIRKRTHGETNRLCLPWDVSWIGTFT